MNKGMENKGVMRMLITRMKFIGDVVLTTPIVHAVRNRYPNAYIAYLGDKNAVSLLERNPYLDKIIPYDFGKPTLLEQPRVAWLVRNRKFDVVVDLFSNPRSALITYLSGARIRIGKDVKGRGNLYTHKIRDDGSSKSAIAFHYQYLRPLEIEPLQWETEIHLSDVEKREARIFMKWQGVDLEKPIVAVHPGATWPNKMWLKESFATLVDRMSVRLNAEVILSLGPADSGLGEYFAGRCYGRIRVLPVLPVRQLAAVLSECNVFVTNDCGPMHIAVAVGTPTIGIFGPEPEDVWFPYSEKKGHIAIRKKIWCSPCRTTKCFREPADFLECMKLVTVEEIFDAVAARVRPQ